MQLGQPRTPKPMRSSDETLLSGARSVPNLSSALISRLALAAGLLLFAAPAFVGLADQTWQSEAGSLAPIILALGGWSLWASYRAHAELCAPGKALIWLPLLVLAVVLMTASSALDFVTMQALALWLGVGAVFYALVGKEVLQKSALPLVLLILVVPLPYSVSVQANVALREWLSETSVSLGSMLGLDVALEYSKIAVGPYELMVENACAGANSTLSLAAITILLAFWLAEGSRWHLICLIALAIPIALLANLVRVLALMALVSVAGVEILETAIHPVSGLVSFACALLLVLACSAVLQVSERRRNGPVS